MPFPSVGDVYALLNSDVRQDSVTHPATQVAIRLTTETVRATKGDSKVTEGGLVILGKARNWN